MKSDQLVRPPIITFDYEIISHVILYLKHLENLEKIFYIHFESLHESYSIWS